MHIEVHQPRLEALIEQRMASGRFQTIEDALVQALEAAPLPPEPKPAPVAAENLEQVFAKMRGLLTDEEVDTLFTRNPSVSRPVDFE